MKEIVEEAVMKVKQLEWVPIADWAPSEDNDGCLFATVVGSTTIQGHPDLDGSPNPIDIDAPKEPQQVWLDESLFTTSSGDTFTRQGFYADDIAAGVTPAEMRDGNIMRISHICRVFFPLPNQPSEGE